MKKQSSIEWMEQRIKEMFLPLSQEETLLKDIQQAKKMHKQEVSKAYYDGYNTEHVGYEKTISEYSIDYYKNNEEGC